MIIIIITNPNLLIVSHKYITAPLLFLIAIIATSNNSYASQKNKYINIKSVFEFHSNDQFSSDDKNNKYIDSFGRNETAITVNLTDNLSIESMFVLERLNEESANGEDRAFDGEGVFTEELKLKYETNHFTIFGGKFNPNFGSAWDWGRGIWTHKLAENYEQTEKLGGGVSISALNHTLGISAFHNDVKILDGSTITKRGNTARNDGTPGNSDNFESYNISLEAENPFNIEGFSYNAAFLNLASDIPTNVNQRGFVVGANYAFDLNKDVNLDSLVEMAGFNNLDGNKDKQQRFITANVIATFKDSWNVTVGIAKITNEESATPDSNQNLFQLSAGYKFANNFILPGLTIEAGYKDQSEDIALKKVSTKSLGVLARYIITF